VGRKVLIDPFFLTGIYALDPALNLSDELVSEAPRCEDLSRKNVVKCRRVFEREKRESTWTIV